MYPLINVSIYTAIH